MAVVGGTVFHSLRADVRSEEGKAGAELCVADGSSIRDTLIGGFGRVFLRVPIGLVLGCDDVFYRSRPKHSDALIMIHYTDLRGPSLRKT